MIKFKDLLEQLESHKKYILKENEEWSPPTEFKDLEVKYKNMFNKWLYTNYNEWIKSQQLKNKTYSENFDTVFGEDDEGSEVIQLAWKNTETPNKSMWFYDKSKYGYKKTTSIPKFEKEFEKDGKTYCSDPTLPLKDQETIQDPKNPDGCIPNPNYVPGFFQAIWDSFMDFVSNATAAGVVALIVLTFLLKYIKGGLEFLIKYFGPSVKWFLSKTSALLKDLLRWLANLARTRSIKGASAKNQRSAFDKLNKELITALNKMKNSKAANPTLRSAAGQRALNEMIKLLEAPETYKINKQIFDATLTQLFQSKKISAEVYKASMNPRTLVKQGPIIDQFVIDNKGEAAWRAAGALFP
jgi:hypothetical protein